MDNWAKLNWDIMLNARVSSFRFVTWKPSSFESLHSEKNSDTRKVICSLCWLNPNEGKSLFPRPLLWTSYSSPFFLAFFKFLFLRLYHREQRILSAIARIGFPMPNPPPSSTSLISRNPKRKLKAIVYSVIFLQRTEYVLPLLFPHPLLSSLSLSRILITYQKIF